MLSLFLASLLLCLPGWGAMVEDVPDPRNQGSNVADIANVVSEESEEALGQQLADLRATHGLELVLVTLDATDPAPAAFVQRLHTRWGLDRDDPAAGVLALLVVGEGRVFFAKSDSLDQRLPDTWLAEMGADEMNLRFRQGDFDGGMRAGVRAIDDWMGQDPAVASTWQSPAERWTKVGIFLLASLMAVVGTGLSVFALLRYREGRCPKCSGGMDRLQEVFDGTWIDDGQNPRAVLGVRRWVVYQCPSDGEVRLLERSRIGQPAQRCIQCHRVGPRGRFHQVDMATGPASVTVKVSCAHCQHAHQVQFAGEAELGPMVWSDAEAPG